MLVDDEKQQVNTQSRDEDRRQDQDVQHVEPRHDIDARELAAEEEVGDPGPNDRDSLDHSVDDAQSVTGEQVIGERVAGEALCHRKDEQNKTDEPVDLTRLAVCAGEVDAEHVEADGSNKKQCCPVVDLAHQKATADIEGDIER